MVQLKRKKNTAVENRNGTMVVTLHATDIVSFDADIIVLNSGGWKTDTTKNRMNQTAREFDLGFSVYQSEYNWYVTFKGQDIPFDKSLLVLDR